MLRKGPFTLDEARAAGVTASAIRSPAWKRLGKGIYRWQHANADPWLLLAAWRRAVGGQLTFAGYSAAWMFGIDCAPASPVEVIVPLASAARSCSGLVVRHCDLQKHEVVEVRRLRLTSLKRTLRDICVAKAPVDALVIIDAALRRRLTDAVGL